MSIFGNTFRELNKTYDRVRNLIPRTEFRRCIYLNYYISLFTRYLTSDSRGLYINTVVYACSCVFGTGVLITASAFGASMFNTRRGDLMSPVQLFACGEYLHILLVLDSYRHISIKVQL
jgi:hypothetical protein